jgi:hypothetical protein
VPVGAVVVFASSSFLSAGFTWAILVAPVVGAAEVGAGGVTLVVASAALVVSLFSLSLDFEIK